MPSTEKICPLSGAKCDPVSDNYQNTANLNCSFFISDMFSGRCLYIDAMKSFPQIAENLKKLKIPAA